MTNLNDFCLFTISGEHLWNTGLQKDYEKENLTFYVNEELSIEVPVCRACGMYDDSKLHETP